MLVIDEELRTFIEGGRATSIGTRSHDLVPRARRAWGARVTGDGRAVEIFIDKPSSDQIVANIRDNGRVALCFVDIFTLRSLQIKGRCIEILEPATDDWGWVERHHEAFAAEVAIIGFPRETIRHMWSLPVLKLRVIIEEFYDQTPGPDAGRRL